MSQNGKEDRRLAAIMFTDMVGYSAFVQRDEALALQVLEEHRRLLRSVFPQHGGLEIETAGDAFLAEFSSALEATRCALAIQEAVASHNASCPPAHRFQLRVGVHVGDVIHRDGQVMGDAVNIAARLEPLAEPGGICVSRAVYEQWANKLPVSAVRLSRPELKNIHTPVEVFRVVMPLGKTNPPLARPKPALPYGAIGLGISFMIVAAGLGWWLMNRPPHSDSAAKPDAGQVLIRSIAVKAIEYRGADTDQTYLAEGMTDILTSCLGSIKALEVHSPYRGRQESIPSIAKDLHVDAVIVGSILRQGTRLLIVLRLVQGLTDRQLWTDTLQGDVADFFALQSQAAKIIAAQLNALLSPEEKSRLAAREHKHNPDAVEAYLRGRPLLLGSESNINESISWFNKAIQLETNYAEPYVGLAWAYHNLANVYKAPKECMPLVLSNALMALQLDETLAEANSVLSNAKLIFDFDFAEAERQSRIALRLNPNDAGAHVQLGLCLDALGRFDETFAELDLAEKLDPLSPGPTGSGQWAAFFARKYDRAIRYGERCFELGQTNSAISRGMYGLAKVQQSGGKEGLADLKAARGIEQPENPVAVSMLAYGYALAGQKEPARKTVLEVENIAKHRIVCAYEIATVYVALGESDTAFKWLNKALADRSWCIPYTKVDPRLDPLHSDRRFAQLLREIGFGAATVRSDGKNSQ